MRSDRFARHLPLISSECFPTPLRKHLSIGSEMKSSLFTTTILFFMANHHLFLSFSFYCIYMYICIIFSNGTSLTDSSIFWDELTFVSWSDIVWFATDLNTVQLLQMFSELTSIDGLLTSSDWNDLFHHVQVNQCQLKHHFVWFEKWTASFTAHWTDQ